MKTILITMPKRHLLGGVSAFWNAVLPELVKNKALEVTTLEIGGHGKNVLGPFLDQYRVFSYAKKKDLVVLNPSLGARSFFRDAWFTKHLLRQNVPYMVFFHGWDLGFEKKVSEKYTGFFNRTFGQASRIFVLSASFGHKIRAWGFKGPITIMTTAIDSKLLKDFSLPQKLNRIESSSVIKILFLSRLVLEKGIMETVEAFRSLRKEFPNTELIIAGNGSAYNAVKEFVSHDKDITLVGHVEGETKKALFKDCHIYCLPSYTEGLPTSVLEAMAFAMPVITTPVGGLRDFFREPEMGFLAQPKNSTDLLEKLTQLVSHRALMAQMAHFNYQYAQKNLLAPVVAQQLMDHFKEGMPPLGSK